MLLHGPKSHLYHTIRAHVQRGECSLSYTQLSRETGLHPCTIATTVKWLCAYGYLVRDSGGGGKASTYRIGQE